jgi:tRNA nucleotidyltransferase (CCA-adding enzyme)
MPIDPVSLRTRFWEELAPEVRLVMERIVSAVHPAEGVYAVGGIVRDLLLGRDISEADLDIATLADAIGIATGASGGPSVTAHERFRTATILVGARRIDLATARRETYARPGALPDVAPAGIEDDLRRRDFSMNALALRLDGEAALIDPTGGARDISARLVRVLHDRSFEDDATRIFRAFRYARRLGFTIEPHTRSLITDGVRFIATISGERLRHELHLLFDEPTGGDALSDLHKVGALSEIAPGLGWSPRASGALAAFDLEGRRERGFALAASGASASEAEAIVGRLQLSLAEASAVRAMHALPSVVEMLRRADVKPSGVVTLLDRYPVPAIEAFAGLHESDEVGAMLLRYLEEWRHERPILDGHDLMELGVPEGPQIKRGLQLIRAARLDGWATDRDDERALILRFAKSIRDSRAMQHPLDFKLYEN